jgi:hypothetical protein
MSMDMLDGRFGHARPPEFRFLPDKLCVFALR